jgi:hypothetical protein
MSASAASGATHAGPEIRRAGDTAEAEILANEIAMQIGQIAVAHGWIAQAALE